MNACLNIAKNCRFGYFPYDGEWLTIVFHINSFLETVTLGAS